MEFPGYDKSTAIQTAVFGMLNAFKAAYKRFAKILPPPKIIKFDLIFT
jgi:hypothetical protein